jgi:hypothetical protein
LAPLSQLFVVGEGMFTVKLPEEPLIEKVLITNNRECLDDLKTGFVDKWDRQHSNRIHIFNIAE